MVVGAKVTAIDLKVTQSLFNPLREQHYINLFEAFLRSFLARGDRAKCYGVRYMFWPPIHDARHGKILPMTSCSKTELDPYSGAGWYPASPCKVCRPCCRLQIYNTVCDIKDPKVSHPVIIVSRKTRLKFYMAARRRNTLQIEITLACQDGLWIWIAYKKAHDQLNEFRDVTDV